MPTVQIHYAKSGDDPVSRRASAGAGEALSDFLIFDPSLPACVVHLDHQGPRQRLPRHEAQQRTQPGPQSLAPAGPPRLAPGALHHRAARPRPS